MSAGWLTALPALTLTDRPRRDNHGKPAMKAIICDHWGPPDELQFGERPRPDLAPGQVRIRVRACGLNFADALMVQGLYQEKPPFPFTPGMEIAGEVLETAGDIEGPAPGSRVIAITDSGGLAEEVVVSPRQIFSIPDGLSAVDAATVAIAYGTSHLALARRAALQPGETLLVHGAAGGVGLAAVQLGKLLGARVIATASTPEKCELARRFGADETINYLETDFVEAVRAITNRQGAHVIFDPVGGDVFDRSLRCVAWEGRLLVVGFASGVIPRLPANMALLKNCSVVGVYWGGYLRRNPEVLRQSLAQVIQWAEAGRIKPHISKILPLARAPEGLDDLRSRRATGRIVVRLDG